MSSPALLEPGIPYPLDVKGKKNVDIWFGVDGCYSCLSFMYGYGGSDGAKDGAIFKQEVGI